MYTKCRKCWHKNYDKFSSIIAGSFILSILVWIIIKTVQSLNSKEPPLAQKQAIMLNHNPIISIHYQSEVNPWTDARIAVT